MPAISVETIWHDFHTPLSHFIRHRVPDDATAEDVLQEVYLKIHRQLHTLRSDTQLRAWVYQITRNAIIDFYRSQKPEIAIDEVVELPDVLDETDDLIDRLTHSIQNMLNIMPATYREALILTEYEGLSQKQLAERLGLSFSGAKSRVQRARKMLRELLLACCHFHFDRYGMVIDFQGRCQCCANSAC